MRITERYRRRDFGHMDLEVTLEDRRTTRGRSQLRLNESDPGQRRSRFRMR
jgi:hypothetical protein